MHELGLLRKMRSRNTQPIDYLLEFSDNEISLQQYIGRTIRIQFNNYIACVHCDKKIKKSYGQGHCFLCSQKLARCDLCILKPSNCHYHKGTCREPNWAKDHCFQDHYIYLANTSGLKVGLTRHSQIPTRWVDQGASQALLFFKMKSRYHAGIVEDLIAEQVNDKTNWRTMLSDVPDIDLLRLREEIFEKIASRLIKLVDNNNQKIQCLPCWDDSVKSFKYPVLAYPKQIKSLNLDKEPVVEGTLLGIKGQYLLLDVGVINIRKFAGYLISFST